MTSSFANSKGGGHSPLALSAADVHGERAVMAHCSAIERGEEAADTCQVSVGWSSRG